MEEFKKTTAGFKEPKEEIDLEEQEKQNREKKIIDEIFDEDKIEKIKEADSVEKLMELIGYRKMSLESEGESNEKAKEYYDRLEWLVQDLSKFKENINLSKYKGMIVLNENAKAFFEAVFDKIEEFQKKGEMSSETVLDVEIKSEEKLKGMKIDELETEEKKIAEIIKTEEQENKLMEAKNKKAGRTTSFVADAILFGHKNYLELIEKAIKEKKNEKKEKEKEAILGELESKIKALGESDFHNLRRKMDDNLPEQTIEERYSDRVFKSLIKGEIDFEKAKALTIKEIKEVIESVYKERTSKEKAGEQRDNAVDKEKIENALGEWMKKKTALRIEEGGEEKYILTVCTPGAEIEWVWVGTKEGEKAERLKKEEIYKFNSEKIGGGESAAEEGKNEVKKEKGEEKKENFETRVVKAKKELFENAGSKSKEELVQLIDSVEKILDGEKEKGKGKLKDKISEIRDSEFGKEKFMDGSIVYLPKDGEAIFIGDTHGDPDATVSVIEQEKFIEAMESGEKNKYLVFLGDYVDRGKGNVENIEQIIALYEKYPDNVILLRGNHETTESTSSDEFLFSLLKKYGNQDTLKSLVKYDDRLKKNYYALTIGWKDKFKEDDPGKELFEKYHKLFEKLPGVVACANGVVGVHGGIPNEDIKSLKELNDPKKLYEMRWNDPSSFMTADRELGNRGSQKLSFFSEKAFDRFMDTIGGKIMIRAHEETGNFENRDKDIEFNNKLVTVFSTGKSEKGGYDDDAMYTKFNLEKEIDRITVDDIKKVEYIKPNYKLETEKPKKEENKETAAWINIRNSYRNKSKDIENRYKKASAEDKKKIEDYLKSDVLDSSVLESYGMDPNEENKKKALEIQKEVHREILDKLKPNQIPIPRPEPEKPKQKEAPSTLNELFNKLGEDGEKLREILARFEEKLKTDVERLSDVATSEEVKRIEKKMEDSERLTQDEINIMVKMERTNQTVVGDRINTNVTESQAFYLASADKNVRGMLENRVLASEVILKQYEQYFASRKKEEDFKWKENPEGAKAAKKLSKATGEKTKGFWEKIGEKLNTMTEEKIIPYEEWYEFGDKLIGVKDEKSLKEAVEFLREKTRNKKISEKMPEDTKNILEEILATISNTNKNQGIQWYLSAIEDGDAKNNNNFTTALKKDRELIGKAPRGACKNSLNKLLDKIEEIWKLKIGTDEKLDELEKITAEISGTGEAVSKPEGKSRERQTAGTTTLYDWAMDKYRGARKTIAENSIARATGISKAIYKGDYESFKKKRETIEEEKKAYRQAKTPKARYDEILNGAWKGKSDTEFAAIMEVMIEKKELTIDEMSKHLSSEEIKSLEESISEALMKRGFAFDVDELKKSMPQLASQVELKPEDSQSEVDKKTMEYTKEIVSEGKLASLNRAAMEDPIVINTIRKEHNDFDVWVRGRSETDKQSIKRGLEGMLLILDGKIRAAGKGDITNVTGGENEKIVSVAGVEMTKNELLEEISNIKKSLANSDKNGHNMLNKPATDNSGEIALNKEGRIDFENGTINEKARKEFAESMKGGKDTYKDRTVEFYEAMGRYFSEEQFKQVKKHCSPEQKKAAKKSALMAPLGSVSQEILEFLKTDSDYRFLKIEGDIREKINSINKINNIQELETKLKEIQDFILSHEDDEGKRKPFYEFNYAFGVSVGFLSMDDNRFAEHKKLYRTEAKDVFARQIQDLKNTKKEFGNDDLKKYADAIISKIEEFGKEKGRVEKEKSVEKKISEADGESTKKHEKGISAIFDKDIEKIRKGSAEEILKEIKDKKKRLNSLDAADEKSGKKIKAYQIALDLVVDVFFEERKRQNKEKTVDAFSYKKKKLKAEIAIMESIKKNGNESAAGFLNAVFYRLAKLDNEEQNNGIENFKIKEKAKPLAEDIEAMSKKEVGNLLDFLRYNLTHGHIDKKQKLPALTARFEKESQYKKYKDLLEKRKEEIKNITIEDLKNAVEIMYEEKQ